MAHALLAYYSVRLPKNQYPYVSMYTESEYCDDPFQHPRGEVDHIKDAQSPDKIDRGMKEDRERI